jgi:hypothetical protein
MSIYYITMCKDRYVVCNTLAIRLSVHRRPLTLQDSEHFIKIMKLFLFVLEKKNLEVTGRG